MKFCFIILHYLQGALKDTIECVNSIEQNIESCDYSIIIVDNGSNDRSKEIMQEKYKNHRLVDVLALDNNLGFAKGNNYGSMFAKKKYNPDYLIIINNDTIIKQSNFLDLIEKEHIKNGFAVLGPFIFDKNNKPQNPMQRKPIDTVEDIENNIKKVERLIYKIETSNSVQKLKQNIKTVIRKNRFMYKCIRKIFEMSSSKPYLYDPTHEHENILLHGSALIFSKDYFLKKDYIFYPKTFMYVEEEILHYICKRDDLTMRYQPKIIIYHKEDASTNILHSEINEKRHFIRTQQLNSYKVFRDLVINDKKSG